MSIEAMKQALEALCELEHVTFHPAKVFKHKPAITALRLAIEQAEKQEPVEWLTGCPECGADSGCDCDSGTWNPPGAQRQPLTDEELEKIFPAIATYHEANKTLYRSIARAIEAAHGIKEQP